MNAPCNPTSQDVADPGPFVAPRREKPLPYPSAGAPCCVCGTHLHGDWGLVPDCCDVCNDRAYMRWQDRRIRFLESHQPRETRGAQESSGWVIEGAWSSADVPDYWYGSSVWGTDPYRALRFANQGSAVQAADLMCSGMKVRICEHGWTEQPETTRGESK